MVGGPRLFAGYSLSSSRMPDEDHTLVHRERYIGASGINHPETVPDETFPSLRNVRLDRRRSDRPGHASPSDCRATDIRIGFSSRLPSKGEGRRNGHRASVGVMAGVDSGARIARNPCRMRRLNLLEARLS